MGLMQTDFARRALTSNWLVAVLKYTVIPLDPILLRLSRGWINVGMQSVVLLETVGAKSGQRRRSATMCMPEGKDLVVAGSNWGGQRSPAWVFNLRANPQARATYRGYVGPVVAEEISGDERSELWEKLVAFNPTYARYEETNDRLIPVIRLRRIDE